MLDAARQGGISTYIIQLGLPTGLRPIRLHRHAAGPDKVKRQTPTLRLMSLSGFAFPACARSPRQRLSDFLSEASFPCLGAKSALNTKRMHFAEYSSLGNQAEAIALCHRLQEFSASFPDPGNLPASLVAMFNDRVPDEMTFETKLWRHLQLMHEYDRTQFDWDPSVGSDPAQNDFSLSVGGRAFFVVGLHPASSRLARRAPFPCLVFNFHDQFESLKASGKYQSMQTAIRERDLKLQGSINPVLARFGEASEARQYSGRAVDKAWRCPFHTKGAGHA